MTIRSIDELINEAASIGIRFKEMPRNAAKDPYTVDRVIAIYQASGLSTQEFVRRTKGFSASTLYMWSRGKGTNGEDWPALKAATAKREGAALAASINASGLGGGSTTQSATMPADRGAARPSRAVAVTKWLDTAGNEHGSEHEAEAASYAHDTYIAADALGAAMGLSVVSSFVVHADKVLALADAIRAEQVFRALEAV